MLNTLAKHLDTEMALLGLFRWLEKSHHPALECCIQRNFKYPRAFCSQGKHSWSKDNVGRCAECMKRLACETA